MYNLKLLKYKLGYHKIKYYLIKNCAGLILLFFSGAIGLFIGFCWEFSHFTNAKLILIPSSLTIIAIFIGYGFFLRQMQLKINDQLKEIQYFKNGRTNPGFLFYLVLKTYFINAYINYILGSKQKTLPNSTLPIELFSHDAINYFCKFKKTTETGHQFYKRTFDKYDSNLIKKYKSFLKILYRENMQYDGYNYNIYFVVQRFFLEMKMYVYQTETVAYEKMKIRLKELDFYGIKGMQFLQFNVFETELTKITYEMLEQKDSKYGKYRPQLGRIRHQFSNLLLSLNLMARVFFGQLFYNNNENIEGKQNKISFLESNQKIKDIAAELLHYTETSYGTCSYQPVIFPKDKKSENK